MSALRFQSWSAQGVGALREAQWDALHRDDAAGCYAIARTFSADGGEAEASQAVLAAAAPPGSIEARFAAAQAAARVRDRRLGAALTVLDLAAGRLGHVGDALVIRRRGAAIERLNEAHTLANALRALGEAIPAHQPSVLVRALGFERTPATDLIDVTAQADDTFLVLSGGLARLTEVDRLAPVLGAAEPGGVVQWMVDRATQQGASDNLSAILIRAYADAR